MFSNLGSIWGKVENTGLTCFDFVFKGPFSPADGQIRNSPTKPSKEKSHACNGRSVHEFSERWYARFDQHVIIALVCDGIASSFLVFFL